MEKVLIYPIKKSLSYIYLNTPEGNVVNTEHNAEEIINTNGIWSRPLNTDFLKSLETVLKMKPLNTEEQFEMELEIELLKRLIENEKANWNDLNKIQFDIIPDEQIIHSKFYIKEL